jgi:hypothetical protein
LRYPPWGELRPASAISRLLLRRNQSSLVLLGAYLFVAFFYFAIPALLHPRRDLIGFGHDPDLFVWMLAWWPHAILHGENPVVTHAVWWPQGVDLAWATSVPGLALLVAPVTLLGGPVLSYNVLSVLLPALAAWTAYLLCRHLTRSFWPSAAGGYLFGFSPYVLLQTEGHLHMSSVFLVPLIALVLVRYLEGSLTGRRFVLVLAVLLALQISFSTEVAFTLTLAIGVALLVGSIVVPASRSRIRLLLLPLAGAYALATVIVAPFLAYALARFPHGAVVRPSLSPAGLLNLVIPTRLSALSWSWTASVTGELAGNDSRNGVYLGIPLLAILVWFGWSFRRTAVARLLVPLLGLGVVAELGVRLDLFGRYIPLPWRVISTLPLFDDVLPVRISMFVSLAASVCVAWWSSSRRVPRAARLTLTAAAIASVVPSVWLGLWHEHPYRPAFFAQGTYRTCLERNDSVLMLPFPNRSDAMLWQAEAEFAFRMANGYLAPAPPPNVKGPDFTRRLHGPIPDNWRPLIAWARSRDVTTIIAAGNGARSWVRLLAPFERPRKVAGVNLYDVRGNGGPPCKPGSTGRLAWPGNAVLG